MKFLLFAVAGLLLVGILLIIVIRMLAKRPYYHRVINLADFRTHLAVLLKRGYDGGFMVIEDTRSERFIQFKKYIREPGHIGLEMGFPKAPWSKQYYENLKNSLLNQNIRFAVQPTGSGPVSEFTEVDCGSNIDLAYRLVEIILHDVFKLPEPSRTRVYFVNMSLEDELIDSKR